MPSPERPHRLALDDLADSDTVHELTPGERPELADAVLVRPFNGKPRLTLTEAHETAIDEAKKRSLTGTERLDFIHDFHRENHRRTKSQALDELKSSVLPDPANELSEEQRRYYAALEGAIDTTFSGDPPDRSRLENELKTVIAIESTEDAAEREQARKSQIERLASILSARREDAERIYETLSEQPEVYRAIQQQKQVLLILEHEPDRYEEFIELTEAGDDEAMATFVGSLKTPFLQEQLTALRAEEDSVTEFIRHRDAKRIALSLTTFSDSVPGYDNLSEEHHLLLGRIAEQASPEFLAVINEASLSDRPNGLTGEFLSRPFVIRNDGTARIGRAEVHRLDAAGIRQSAAIDMARSRRFEVFEELSDEKAGALLEPFFQFDRVETLPVHADLNRIAQVLDVLGLQTDIADGWLILRDFQLLDDQSQPNPPGIRRLIRQLRALSDPSSTSVAGIDPHLLSRILKFWDREGASPRHSTILTATDASALR